MERATLNNCYSLLHQLLDQEKDLNILHFIKSEHPDLQNLMKRIAAASGTGSKLLEELSQKDPSIRLQDLRLPPGEIAVRDAIAATERNSLLSQTGDEFELTLLLTQAEAVSYGWHLAKVAGDMETRPDHVRALAAISQDMKKLHDEVFGMLLSKKSQKK